MQLTEAQLDQRDAELDRVIADARAEKEMIAATKRYMALMKSRSETPDWRPPASEPAPAEKPLDTYGFRETRNGKPTLTSLIIRVLRDVEDPWMTAREIQTAVSKLQEQEVPMSAISPKLSELRGKAIVRKDLRVALKQRAGGDM